MDGSETVRYCMLVDGAEGWGQGGGLRGGWGASVDLWLKVNSLSQLAKRMNKI